MKTNKRRIIEDFFKTKPSGLFTETIIYKKDDFDKSALLIPRWAIWIIILTLITLLGILIAAILIVTNAKNPGLYLENCNQRSCSKENNLKCINDICQCEANQYYTTKCMDKKDYLGLCQKSEQCLYSLSCIGGKCQCSSNQYFDNDKKCKQLKTYSENCKENLCLSSQYLYCSTTTGKCACSSDRYWDGEVCVLKKMYSERCTLDSQCVPNKNLYCIGNICTCPTNYYYDTTSLSCYPKLDENSNCTSKIQCLGALPCSNGTCQCAFNEYFNRTTLTCMNRTLENTGCLSSTTCRVDLGLTCQNGSCECNTTYFYWNTTLQKCEPRTGYYTNCVSSISCLAEYVCTDFACVCPARYAFSNTLQRCVLCSNDSTFWYNDRCYREFSATTWANAKATCDSLNMWLMTPKDLRELNMVVKYYPGKMIWIGYSRPSCSFTQWDIVSNSLSPTYIKWCNGEPNCSGGSENCMQIMNTNCYNDYGCGINCVFLCQYEP